MKRSKKVLVVGASSSKHLQDFVENIKKYSKSYLVIDILSTHSSNNKSNENLFNCNHFHFFRIYSWWRNHIMKGSRYIFAIEYYLWRWATFGKKEYDVIFIHGLIAVNYSLCIKSLARISSKIVGALWGTEVNSLNPQHIGMMQKVVDHCDILNVGTKELESKLFSQIEPNAEQVLTYNRFGIDLFDDIDSLRCKSSDELKEIIGYQALKNYSNFITVGYNGFKNQQHLAVLSSLLEYAKEFNDTLLILPLSYGLNKKYLGAIKDLIGNKIPVLYITNYLSNNSVAALRVLTDFFVQVQETDALSAAMQEHIYAGNTVITGDWLEYSTLYMAGIELIRVSSPREVGKTIFNSDELQRSNVREKNIKTIKDISSWGNCALGWIKLI